MTSIRLNKHGCGWISLLKMATMSIPHRWKYDVFVNFRGEDIRKSFMDNLFKDFKQNGIHAFRDDRELPKGDCKEMGKAKHEVQIIFYDVKPDVVRKQKRSYEEALCRHEISNSTKVDKWKEALSMAANLFGCDLEDMTNG
ncbi:NB-ARC domains-containing protein [Tanacetum coccineum]